MYFAMMAVQSARGVPVPMYQDAIAAEMVYVFHNAEIAFAIVEDQEQVDKMLEVREQHAPLKHIYYDDPRGCATTRRKGCCHTKNWSASRGAAGRSAEVHRRGNRKGLARRHSGALYTSGTTGKPKGVVQTIAR